MGGQLIRRGGDAPGMGPQPNMDNGGRWHHIASDAEIKRAMADKQYTAMEAPIVGITFLISHSNWIILRAGAMGGDVRNIEGGWVYHSLVDFLKDVEEIKSVCDISR